MRNQHSFAVAQRSHNSGNGGSGRRRRQDSAPSGRVGRNDGVPLPLPFAAARYATGDDHCAEEHVALTGEPVVRYRSSGGMANCSLGSLLRVVAPKNHKAGPSDVVLQVSELSPNGPQHGFTQGVSSLSARESEKSLTKECAAGRQRGRGREGVMRVQVCPMCNR